MRCSEYCAGYCFYHGDTGEVCDKIAWGTNRIIKDGFCPKEADIRELEELADGYIKAMEERERNVK
jgi:hypothetical protein